METLEERAVPAISIVTSGVPVTQNFNSLATTGTSSALPADWVLNETGTNANATYTAGTGGVNTGDTYSFGSASVPSDRALGGLQSGSLIPSFGASFTNNTGAAIISLAISYQGEQWRFGQSGRGADRLDFQYSLTATSMTSGTWIDVNALDFNSPITTGTVGALDGNAAANKTALSSTISSLNISPGATFWIRWNDFNVTGSDDGLAVDDFSLTGNVASGANTATTLDTISAPSIFFGDSVTFTGTVVNQSGSTTPAGTIEIRNGGATGTLLASTTTIGGSGANGTYSITSTTVPTGTFNSLQAYFIPGSGSFNASNGAGPSLIVNNVAFTAGNLAVFQADEADGNSPFSIIEVKAATAGQTAVNGVPINGTSGDYALRIDGTTTQPNGYLATTNYGQYLAFTGITGDSVLLNTGNASGNVPRGVGILDAAGAFTTPPASTLPSTNPYTYLGTQDKQPRGATSIDNSTWFITDDGGIYTNNTNNPLGAAEKPATTNAGTGFYRSTKSFGGTVYIGISSSSAANAQVSTLSAPTAAGVIASLPGLPNSTTIKDFYLIQSGNNGSAYDVLYVMSSTSATAGTISKFALVSGSWVAKGTSTTTFGGFGIAAADNADGALLYVTSGTGTESGGSVIKLADNANWNANIDIVSAANVVLYTAPTPKILKGISFTPQNITVSPPTVTTPTSTALTASSATLGGTVTADGNALVTERGVIYVPTSLADADPEYGESNVLKQVTTGTLGVFTANVAGLTAGIEYTYRAYATNSAGTMYSDLGTFSTPSSALTPSVDSPAATNIAPFTVTLGGNVASDGGSAITERGVIFVLTSLADADPVEFETGVIKQAAMGSPSIGSFTVDLSGLDASTSYTYRIYADNGIGRTYSAVATFTTAAAVAPQITSSGNLAIRPAAAATFQVASTGNPTAYTYSLSNFSSGASSDWITIDANGLISFANNGNRPTVSSPTDYTFTITVDNGVAPPATQTFTLTDGAVAIIYATPNSTYSQSFDNLLSPSVPADNQVVPQTVLPIGWKVAESTADTDTRIGAGVQTTGDSYLFGTSASNERALGTLLSGSNTPTIGAVIANTTGTTLTQFTITFTGEQWRRGGAAIADALTFGYRIDANPATAAINSGTFTTVSQLSFSSPITAATAEARDGNDPANQSTKSFTVTGLSWAPGQALVIRWLDTDISGSDDGLAIDNFTFSAAAAPSLNAPSVTSMTPVVGPITGGTVVTILGSNFVSITSVTFGGAAAATFTVISVTEISATTAAHAAGAVDVVVANTAGSGSLAGSSDFTFGEVASGAAIDYASPNSAYGQSFDNLLTPSVPADNAVVPQTVLPVGWKVVESNANTDTRISAGAQNTGDSYLFGATASNERALGTVLSGSNNVIIGAVFANTTGTTLTQFTITFTGEQWRRGGAAAGLADTLAFGYRTDANPATAAINSGTFTAATPLNFSSLNTAGAAATLNGNDPANQSSISFTVTGLSWAPGEALVIRWLDTDITGSDDGLAIDNFTFSAAPAVSLSAPTVTGMTPVVGPTTGGTLVTITGANFVSITSVTFGGAAVSFSVVSATEISATTTAQGSGAVDVVVANASGSGSLAGSSDFTFVLAPTVTSVAVNGGPNATLGTTNVTMSLAGQHSVVKQILVTFDQAVTVAPDAFTVTPRTGVSVNGGAAPSTNAATTSVTMISASEYLVTFVDDSLDATPSTHGGGVLNSGVYDLTTLAAKVSVNGITMAANQTSTFFALFGNIEANNLYNGATLTVPAPPGYSSGDGKTKAFVDPGSLFQFSDAFGSNATAPAGPPAYNVVFDSNLDGAIDPGDLFAFSDAFGIDWQF